MIAGVDLHKSTMNIAVMDDEGHVIKVGFPLIQMS